MPEKTNTGWLNEKWEEYRHLAVRQGATVPEVDAARTIFMAGAMTAVRQLVTLWNQAPMRVLPVFLSDLATELAEFKKQLYGSEGAQNGPALKIIMPGDPEHPGVGPFKPTYRG